MGGVFRFFGMVIVCVVSVCVVFMCESRSRVVVVYFWWCIFVWMCKLSWRAFVW